ncbi:hypothetical protein N0V90_006276 [Kalmusia sp. IMI 367209]|nr:hypothetical protein N0V90_006276 [Kalmusia sp. IMI 367209]
MAELAAYDNDPTLYLFTSLTAGSSHIITATSRIETILKANKIPFKGVDTATDELARKLYGRRARGKKLPLLVKEGYVIADLEQVEEWNEYDELKEALGAPAAPAPVPSKPSTTTAAAAPATATDKKENTPTQTPEQNLAIRQLGAEAASVAAAKKQPPTHISTTNPLLASKVSSPSTSTPTKAAASPGGILSPRSIPLPATPGVGKEGITSPTTEFHGRKVESPSEEEIKLVEQQQSIAEVSSSEEEDSEDEEEQTHAKTASKEAVEGAAKEEEEEVAKNKPKEETQVQDAKAADKAGVSVED